MSSALSEYVKNRLESYVNSLRGEERGMWEGEDAIYSLSNWRGMVSEAIDEMAEAGIETINGARGFDLEALWE